MIANNADLKSTIQSLEDLDVFKGSIFNILDYVKVCNNKDLAENVEKLFVKENGIRLVQALLSFGDYSIPVGSTILGGKYFYGNTENLYDILTYSGFDSEEQKKYSDIITAFIKYYQEHDRSSTENALDDIIEENLESIDIRDWRYCLIKYPSTLQNIEEVNNSKLVFCFEDKSENYVLHRMNGKTLIAYHVIPEFIEVRRQLGDKCKPDEIVGKNSDNLGRLLLNCKSEGNVSININDEGDYHVECEMDADKNVANDGFDKYKSNKELPKMDAVQRLVSLSNLLIDGFNQK